MSFWHLKACQAVLGTSPQLYPGREEGRGELRIVGEHVVFRGNGGGTTYHQQRLKGGIENQLLERKGNKNITEPKGWIRKILS